MQRRVVQGGFMSETVNEPKAAGRKADEWAERRLTEYSFYAWRKRLRETGPVRFALGRRSGRGLSPNRP